MEQVAMILGSSALLWSRLLLTLAAIGGLLVFSGLYLGRGGKCLSCLVAGGLSVILGLLGARLVHWYCYPESYGSLLAALADLGTGNFALVGAFAGCLAAAALTRVVGLHRDLPGMLDCMCIAGLACLATGRLAAFFNTTDRGQILQHVTALPWASPVTNVVSGATEYRLATFLLQSMVALALLAALLPVFLKKRAPAGDVTWIFLLIYGASQVVLDSTRYDSLYFRWNGFVSIVQVLGALALAAAIWVFSRRLVKAKGFRRRYVAMWGAIFLCIAGAGYMEYFVQRHGSQALLAYSLMTTFLALMVLLTLTIRRWAGRTDS